MIFIGFGYLMCFLKRYGYSAISFNLIIAAFTIQVNCLIFGGISQGFLHNTSKI